MTMTPQEAINQVMQDMGFVKPSNVSAPTPYAEIPQTAPEPEHISEEDAAFAATVEQVMKNSGLNIHKPH